MKKSLSIFLIFVMMVSMISSVSVFGEVVTATADFTDGTFDESIFGYKTNKTKSEEWIVVNNDAEANADVTLGNYLSMTYAGTYPEFYIRTNGDKTLESGDKLEFEFDMKVENYTKDFNIRFAGGANYRIYITTGGKLKRKLDDNTGTAFQELTIPLISGANLTHPNDKGWKRYKIVFEGINAQLSGVETTHKAIKMTGFYIDGINQIDTTAESYSSLDPVVNPCIWAAFDQTKNDSDTLVGYTYNGTDKNTIKQMFLTFKGKSGATNEILSLDNYSMTTYTSTDTAPVDKGGLAASLRKIQASYAEQYTQSGSDTSQAEYFTAFKKSIDDAYALYKNPSATAEQITDAIADMEVYTIVATNPVYIWDDSFNTDTTRNYLKAEGTPTVEYDATTFADDVTLGGLMKVSKNTNNYPRMAVQLESEDLRIPVDAAAYAKYGRNAFIDFEYDLNISQLWNTSKEQYISYVTYLIDTTSSGLRPFSLEIQPNGTVVYGHHDSAPAEVTVGPSGVFDHTRTNRIKLTVQLTDEKGNATQLVDGIYLNGQKLNDEPIPFTNINPGKDTEANYITRLGFYPNKMENCTGSYYIDNVKICTYNKKNVTDPSHVADDIDVVEAIRTKYAEEKVVEKNIGRYPQEVQNRLSASIKSLEGYYTSATGDKAAILAEAVAVTAALKAANAVVVYDADPGSTVDGDGIYGISNKINDLSVQAATASFDKIAFDGSYGENAYVLTEFDVKTENFAKDVKSKLVVGLNEGKTEFSSITLTGGENSSISLNKGTEENWYSALEDGEWTTIRLITHITDEEKNVVNLNKEFYVNGNNVMLISSEVPGKEFKTSVGGYDNLTFNLTGDGKAYVDNVRVVKFYGKENMPANFAQLITSIRKGDKKLASAVVGENVTEEIKTTYENALSTAKAVAEAEVTPTQDDINKANNTLCIAYSNFLFDKEVTDIDYIKFSGSNGDETPYITAGGRVDSVVITKKANYELDGIMVISLYKGEGQLIDVCTIENALSGIATGTYEIALQEPMVIPADTDGLYIKATIFEDMSNLRPLTKVHTASRDEATIYVAGDSIVQTYNQEYLYPRDGWGAYVSDYYADNISVNNLAISGYTLRSYIDLGKMKTVEQNMKEGDYFFVSFMANDSTGTSSKYVELLDYKNLLRHYGEIAKKHGAQVVYVTSPPVLSKEVDSENCYGNGAYPEAMREIAKELDAPLIDIYKLRKDLQREKGYAFVESAMYMCNEDAVINNFGADSLKADFVNSYYDENGNFRTNDKTHISVWGSKWCASKIAEEMQDMNCSLRYSVNPDSFYEFPTVWTAE